MCPNTKAFFGTTTPKDCAACNAFMTDLSLIAQYDPSHFKVIYSYVTPVRFDLGFWNFLKFYLSKSLVPSVLKSVPNWVVSKRKSVSEKSKTSKKMFVTLSLVLTLNKSVKPLCSVNKFIHSDFSDSFPVPFSVYLHSWKGENRENQVKWSEEFHVMKASTCPTSKNSFGLWGRLTSLLPKVLIKIVIVRLNSGIIRLDISRNILKLKITINNW